MAYEIINLTYPVVLKEIEEVLHDYPNYPYQAVFSIQKLRQKLIAHVLSQVPNEYTVSEEPQKLPRDSDYLYRSLQQRVNREMIIRRGILYILRENNEWISRNISQPNKS